MLQVKFGLSITSSEKADKEKRYCDFDLYSVPYPGMCIFYLVLLSLCVETNKFSCMHTASNFTKLLTFNGRF